MSSQEFLDQQYTLFSSPSPVPFGLVPTQGPPLPRYSTHPIRGLNNEPWISNCFLHLHPSIAANLRHQIRLFIQRIEWINQLPLFYPDLDCFVLQNCTQRSTCAFCARECSSSVFALKCVRSHLDYHPQPPSQ
ncbi:hypothetical protein M408DRAFT_331852 [Serendipita vermifera MAFF 305830]|uniref:Uncharacterized protein n=1 Tax=Serendipita vermifera MAFF 305830 TaxID=933852 RepID=A0A0C2WD12_SERVB|nr:hypothetical protein M408DRAFT_331852 [Serendipita vermifera MAFF 305830]